MSAIKQALLDVASQLPDDCTWDEVIERLYVRQKIEAGLRDLELGRTVDHDEVFREFDDGEDRVD